MKTDLTTLLRMTDVTRWGIVGTCRPQSVAEHTFRVLQIVLEIYDYAIAGLSHNSDDRDVLIAATMVHDLEEVATGDLPAPFKKALEAAAPGIYSKAALACAKDNLHIAIDPNLLLRAQRQLAALEGTWLKPLLKVADLLESMLYLRQWGVDPRKEAIIDELSDALNKLLMTVPVLGAQGGDQQGVWERVKDFVRHYYEQ